MRSLDTQDDEMVEIVQPFTNAQGDRIVHRIPRWMTERSVHMHVKAKFSGQIVLDVDCAFDKETGEVIRVFNLNKVLKDDG